MSDKGYLHPFLDGRRYETGVGEDIRTLLELKVNRISYYIRSLPDWWTHLEDANVLKQWRALASTQEFLADDVWEEEIALRCAPTLTEYQVSWVLDELHCYARRRAQDGCQVSCFERIWESDRSMPEHLRRAICAQIDECFLINGTVRQECLRRAFALSSASRLTVLDFIHPFDFPVISGRTLRFEEDPDDSGGVRRTLRAVLQSKHSAIPTDFYVPTTTGEPLTRLGYINGIPPTTRFSHLLTLTTSALQAFIPLFEHTLTSLHRANHTLMLPRIPVKKPPIQYERGTDPPDEPGQGIGEGTDDEEDEMMWHAWDREVHHWAQTRKPRLPDFPRGGFVDKMKASRLEEDENRVSLRGRNIQVFIKLSRVELTPNIPRFPGGQWTCEGSYEIGLSLDSSGSVVLDSDNVTEGRLGFRMAVTRPIVTAFDPDSACMEYWGKKRYSLLNQHVGSVVMKVGRCITYPNLYQHRLSPFQLVDSARPGYRTTLQFLLVDPEITILSTTDVPPQPASWALQALLDSLDKRLPTEVVLRIMEFAIEEEYFVSDDQRWPLRYAMQIQSEMDRESLGYHFSEWL